MLAVSEVSMRTVFAADRTKHYAFSKGIKKRAEERTHLLAPTFPLPTRRQTTPSTRSNAQLSHSLESQHLHSLVTAANSNHNNWIR